MDRRELLLSGTATLIALAAAPAALGRRLGGTPAALVTADTESHVAVVALGTGRVLRRVATVEGPRAIEAAAGSLVIVCHTEEGAVTILDGRHLEVLRVIRGLGEPRYVAAHPALPLAYVTDSGTGELLTLDLTRRRVAARLDVGGPARHLSILPDQSVVWTALGNEADRIAVVNTRRALGPRLAATFDPPFLAHDVVISPNGRQAWVTGGAARVVGVYDTSTRSLLRRLPADAAPQHVTFARSGARAYVASGDDGTLRTYRLPELFLERTVRVAAGSYNLTTAGAGGGRVFTPSLGHGTLTVLDALGRVLRSTEVARNAHDATFALVA
jgi:DNA-binding beta-propeller fold protein YncE